MSPFAVATLASALFTLAAMIAMVILLFRRRTYERRAIASRASDALLSRQILTLIQEPVRFGAIPEITIDNPDQARRVFGHLLRLTRGEASDRLLRLADQLRLPDKSIKALANPHEARRVDAMRVLEQFPIRRSIDALITVMAYDPEPSVRLEAAAALARVGHLPSPKIVVGMLNLRGQSLNRLHRAIFRASAIHHSHDLDELSRDPQLVNLRPVLVEALGWSDQYTTLPVLAHHALDADPEVRIAALKAARKLGHPGVSSWVLGLLVDPNEVVRVQAARTCGALGLKDAIPVLQSLAESPSWWVKTRAKEALTRLAQPRLRECHS